MPLCTVKNSQNQTNAKGNTLYDMEGEYFLDISKQYLDEQNIFIFKVVSDHLDTIKLNKEFVKQLILKKQKDIINIIIV